MSTQTATEPRSAITGDPDICHLACCDDDTACCGQDVSGDPWAGNGEPVTCPLCVLAWQQGRPACPVCREAVP